MGLWSVWHIRANDADAAALRAGSSDSISRSLVASTADTFDGRDGYMTDARAPKSFNVRAGSLKVLKNDENVSRNCLACRC